MIVRVLPDYQQSPAIFCITLSRIDDFQGNPLHPTGPSPAHALPDCAAIYFLPTSLPPSPQETKIHAEEVEEAGPPEQCLPLPRPLSLSSQLLFVGFEEFVFLPRAFIQANFVLGSKIG
jgi:hypothetical protein